MDAENVVAALMRTRETHEPLLLPAWFQSIEPSDAYKLQSLHELALLRAHGGHRAGTKLGGGSMAELRAMRLTGPIRGPIFSSFMHRSPAHLVRSDFFVCVVEAEIAVVIGKDIAVGSRAVNRDEVADAVSAVIPSLEVADTRWSNFKEAPAAAIVVDLGFAGAWISGEPVKEWRSIDLARLEVALSNNGAVVGSGTGMRAMGDPLLGVCAALADLGQDGTGFKVGDIVSTGTCTIPYLANAGDSLVADFGPLGRVQVDFS